MALTSTTIDGHVARALRFLADNPEVFVGYAKNSPWPTEALPPDSNVGQHNIGLILDEAYAGGSLSASNTKASLNSKPFEMGIETFKVTALSANTFQVRKVSDNSLVGSASYNAQAAAYTNIIPGVSLIVSGLSMNAGDFYQFTVDGPIGFKKAEQVVLVMPDSNGTINHKGTKYAIVDPADAYAKGAHHVYIKATLSFDELPVKSFRMLGIFTGLTRTGAVTPATKPNLLPSEVQDSGTFEMIEHRAPVYRDPDQEEYLGFVIEH